MTRQLFAYDPVIGYRFIPGLRARVRHQGGGYNVRTNRAGFRCDHEVTRSPAPGAFRVLLFGDSFSAGDGVSNGYRFGDLLEKRIDGIEVLNFGLPGSGTDQQYLAFRELARDLEYHLLLVCPFVENIERIVATHRKTVNFTDGRVVERAKPYFTLEAGRLILHHQPCPKATRPAEADNWNQTDDPLRRNVRRIYRRFPGVSRAVKRIRNIRHPMEYEDPNHPAWQLMRAILLAWVSESRSPVVVCPLPTFSHIDKAFSADSIRSRFLELARNDKVTVADLLPDYWRMTAGERRALIFPSDEHPSKRGHEVIAESLAPFIEKAIQRWKRAR